ncbi:MAG TPA: thermonuclease family protein [Hyphomicrobium sp.]|jgi:endonuclease YncB( thermonuclease family)|nr:thermonuclease family protein [Hyphomicrobium sp.]
MFGWRRRSEGFEWREYVRTTILVRRADRQRRIDDVRVAAVEKVKHAADAGAEAGRASVSFMGSQFAKLLSILVEALLDLAAAAFHLATRWSKFLSAVVSDAFRGIAAPFGKALSNALGSAFQKPADAVRAKARLLPEKAKLLPDIARKSPIKPRHVAAALAALGLIYIGGPVLRSADGLAVAEHSPDAPARITVSTEISGRAIAITGDLMRVDGALVRIGGVEAPESRQPCYRANGRRWNCASAAKSNLARVVRGRRVTCTPSGGENTGGYVIAQCSVGKADLATELVESGSVFAVSSYFSSLSGVEDAARKAKKGIWQGEIQRPQEWRDQQWQDAKRDAPDGCPIKGFVRASTKFYALPWSADYDRAKVRTEKGERWFCSEDEAKAAGFTPASRS